MVVAPNASITKRTVESSAPYVALGLLYAYLLYLSWTPDTLRAMFASKYWLPELPSIVRMFASEMTVASAWIHLLAVDLFAASVCNAGRCTTTASRTTSKPGTRSRCACSSARLGSCIMWRLRY
ncbi:hypothetical protein PVAP13_5KG589700 [Panicum virgatum]|uniref:Neoxanthin synthase n=1 Tax=Panicum virgatum TaxID=38727 RepID=A0A8T0SPE0_PANVG|nr:hypothetical protein PVAP13_5KG589700 [Panicum virgatum]